MINPRFQIITDPSKKQPYRVILRGGNGEKVLWSEDYSDIRNAEHVIKLCRIASSRASEYLTLPPEPAKASEPTETPEPTETLGVESDPTEDPRRGEQ